VFLDIDGSRVSTEVVAIRNIHGNQMLFKEIERVIMVLSIRRSG
jgi:hypothetical protein